MHYKLQVLAREGEGDCIEKVISLKLHLLVLFMHDLALRCRVVNYYYYSK